MKKLFLLLQIGFVATSVQGMDFFKKKLRNKSLETSLAPRKTSMQDYYSDKNSIIDTIVTSDLYRLKGTTKYYTIFELENPEEHENLPLLIYTSLPAETFALSYLMIHALDNKLNERYYQRFKKFQESEYSIKSIGNLQKFQHAVFCIELSKLLKRRLHGKTPKMFARFPNQTNKNLKKMGNPNPFIIDYLSSLYSLSTIASYEKKEKNSLLPYTPMHMIDATRTKLKLLLLRPVNLYRHSLGISQQANLASLVIEHQTNNDSLENYLYQNGNCNEKNLLMNIPMVILLETSKEILRQKSKHKIHISL